MAISFLAASVNLIDPRNTRIKPNLLNLFNIVCVLGKTPLLWEVQDVPHREIHYHSYKSAVIVDQRDFYGYTPPGYDFRDKTEYTVLCLLQGFSDDPGGWTAVGQADMDSRGFSTPSYARKPSARFARRYALLSSCRKRCMLAQPVWVSRATRVAGSAP